MGYRQDSLEETDVGSRLRCKSEPSFKSPGFVYTSAHLLVVLCSKCGQGGRKAQQLQFSKFKLLKACILMCRLRNRYESIMWACATRVSMATI